MDEYDVFLDEITRKQTLEDLQTFALMPENIGRQLFIVTPNTLTDIITTHQVKIQRLKAPDRTASHGPQQQIIGFS